MSSPASAGRSDDRPDSTGRRKLDHRSRPSGWGTSDRNPGSRWATSDIRPCDLSYHSLLWIRQGPIVFPKLIECEDLFCYIREQERNKRLGRMLGSSYGWLGRHRLDAAGHVPSWETEYQPRLYWTRGVSEKVRNRIKMRVERHIERQGDGMAYVIPTLGPNVEEGAVLTDQGWEGAVHFDIQEPRTYVLDFVPIGHKEKRRGSYRHVDLASETLRALWTEMLHHRITDRRITTVGIRRRIGGKGKLLGVGSSNPRARQCPHLDHIDLDETIATPADQEKEDIPFGDGRRGTYLYDREGYCLLHREPTMPLFEVLGIPEKGETAEDLIEAKGYDIEEEDDSRYRLRLNDRAIGEMLDTARLYELEAGNATNPQRAARLVQYAAWIRVKIGRKKRREENRKMEKRA